MHPEEIGLLLKQERGQFLEFISAYEYRRAAGQKKRDEDLAREIVRVLSGMANADGGTVLVGVEPDKSVTGMPYDQEELHTIIQAPQNLLRPQLNPSCEKVRLGNLQLLKFEVASGLDPGESLVANPTDGLRDGTEVNIQTQSSKNSDPPDKATKG